MRACDLELWQGRVHWKYWSMLHVYEAQRLFNAAKEVKIFDLGADSLTQVPTKREMKDLAKHQQHSNKLQGKTRP